MAQNITLQGASYSDVPAVILPKTGGGTASFTDVTDTTATASDVAAGKYFYLADGTKTEGTGTGGGGGSVTQDANGYIVLPSTGGGGGGGSAQTATGTFTGGGTGTQNISCSFAPDLIYVYGDLSGDPSVRGIVSMTIVKDTTLQVFADSSTSTYSEYLLYGVFNGVVGYNESDTENPHASYTNSTLTLNMVYNSGTARFASGITYSYKLVKWTS